MISKEKKQAIMAEYARTEGDTGSCTDSKNPGADRASENTSQRSSFQKRSAENGRSEKRSAGLPEENRYRKISCTDRKIRNQKVI